MRYFLAPPIQRIVFWTELLCPLEQDCPMLESRVGETISKTDMKFLTILSLVFSLSRYSCGCCRPLSFFQSSYKITLVSSLVVFVYLFSFTSVFLYLELPNPPFHFSSVAQSCLTLCDPWIAAHQASLSITTSRSLLKLMFIESVKPSGHLILCHPLLLPPVPPSIRVFSNESTLYMRWPKYCSFSFSISLSNEHPGLISFKMDWLDLLAVQGTLKSLLQHHSSKSSLFFFSAQLSSQSSSHIHAWLLEKP